MKLRYTIGLSILALALTVGWAGGFEIKAGSFQDKQEKQDKAAKTAWGKVVSVDASKGSLEIKDRAGKSLTFSWTADTAVTKDGKAVTSADLKAGDTVSIEYDDASGSMVAKTIVISPTKS